MYYWGFFINIAPRDVYFILHYQFFSGCPYFSECDIRMFLFVLCLRNRLSITYVRNYGNGGGSSKICTGPAYRGRGVSPLMCTYTLTLSLFMFCLMMSLFCLYYLTLPSFKMGFFVRNVYFSPMRSISVVMKYAIFILNCLSEPKIAKTLSILIK